MWLSVYVLVIKRMLFKFIGPSFNFWGADKQVENWIIADVSCAPNLLQVSHEPGP